MARLRSAVGLFFSVLAAGVGIVASYLAAQAANALIFFWVVVPIALVVAICYLLVPRLLSVVKKVQAHDSLAERVGSLSSELEVSQLEVEQLRAAVAKSRELGMQEGRAEILGAVRAGAASAPTLTGVSDYAGEIVLVGRAPDSIPLGAWYTVSSTNSDRVWGVVEVLSADPKSVVLRCVRPLVPRYWEALAERIELDDSPPADVVLVPFEVPDSRPAKAAAVVTESTEEN